MSDQKEEPDDKARAKATRQTSTRLLLDQWAEHVVSNDHRPVALVYYEVDADEKVTVEVCINPHLLHHVPTILREAADSIAADLAENKSLEGEPT